MKERDYDLNPQIVGLLIKKYSKDECLFVREIENRVAVPDKKSKVPNAEKLKATKNRQILRVRSIGDYEVLLENQSTWTDTLRSSGIVPENAIQAAISANNVEQEKIKIMKSK